MTVPIRGTTRIAAVVGWPIAHSRSPQMMNAAFAAAGIDAVMVPIAVPPDQLAVVIAGLRAAGALGTSVTIPHKHAVMTACSELSAAAQAIGAVNCLHFDGKRTVGHNTDCDGFVDGLVEAGWDRAARRVVLLGGGGAARAVAYGLRDAEIVVIARDPARVDWTAPGVVIEPWTDTHLHDAFAAADLLVDCTSIALGPDEAEATIAAQLPVGALPDHAWVATLVYHRATALLERARARGLAGVDGRAMLVHQGARAFAIWTGTPAPVETMRRALDDALPSPGT